MLDAVRPLPEGSAVLHIGPHKTGTTSIQSAFHAARDDLAAQGVRYASARRHDADAARSAIGARPRRGQAAAGEWEQVVSGLNDRRFLRRVFSSETLANASDEAAARVVAALDRPELAQVVMVARPLTALIPSQYQQLVQRGAILASFEDWVRAVLGPDEAAAPLFWRRHRLDEQVRRWSGLVGPHNVTVLALEEGNRDFLPTAFERLLRVAPGTLVGRSTNANASLGVDEIELLRSWHQVAARCGIGRARRRVICKPLVRELQDRGVPRRRFELPAWAREQATERSAAMADRVADWGVRVVGDLAALGDRSGRS